MEIPEATRAMFTMLENVDRSLCRNVYRSQMVKVWSELVEWRKTSPKPGLFPARLQSERFQWRSLGWQQLHKEHTEIWHSHRNSADKDISVMFL